MTILFLVITPLIAACASILIPKGTKALSFIAISATAAEFVFASRLALDLAYAKHFITSTILSVDALGAITVVTVALVGLCVAIYSHGYLQIEVAKKIIGFSRVKQYYTLLHLFLFAMFFATLTTAPILMWIAIEATTLSTAFLVSFYNKPSAMEAAWKYLIINSIGLLLAFFGTLLFFTAHTNIDGSFITWMSLYQSAPFLNPLIAKMAFIFILIGYGTKVGLVPMHTWKPDAYSKAPTPIVALFSGALLNVALLALLKSKVATDIAVGPAFSQHLLIGFGLLSLVVTAFIIFTQWNYKRLLAYSSIEHAGIMALGFGFGGIGTFAAILHMVYHSLAKSVLFFAAGNIFVKFSSTKIAKVSGAFTVLPITGILFFMGFLAATGIPPFGTFLTEFYIIAAGITYYPVISGIAVAMLGLVFVGFLTHIVRMFFGDVPEGVEEGEAGFATLLPAAILLVVLIACSVFLPEPLHNLLISATKSLTVQLQ